LICWGVPLSPAASAQGLVAIANESGTFQTETLKAGLEARPVKYHF